MSTPFGDPSVGRADGLRGGSEASGGPAVPGDVFTTVLPGLPIGGYLPLWHDDGRVTYWRMNEPDSVLAKLGVGALARAEVDTRRYRDAFMFSEHSGALFLMSRFRSEGGASAPSVQLNRATDVEAGNAATEEALSGLFDWLGDVVVSAAGRGEFVAVETGGWDVPFEPYVLVLLQPENGDWSVAIETRPAPLGAPVWRDQQPEDPDGQSLIAPADEEVLHAAGYLIGCAISTWSVPFSRVGLSFGPNPALATAP